MSINYEMKINILVILAEPEGKNLGVALNSGKLHHDSSNGYLRTIAEGIKIKELSNCLKLMVFETLRVLFVYQIMSNYNLLSYSSNLQVCELAFPILYNLAEHKVITVSDEEMKMATKLIAERMKLVVEYAAGAALAAVLYHQEKIIRILNKQDDYKIAIVLCGGNIDFTI